MPPRTGRGNWNWRESLLTHPDSCPTTGGHLNAAATAVVYMSRPRGYFGIGRDTITLNGSQPSDIAPGVPTNSTTRVVVAAGTPVVGRFNAETITAASFPAADQQVSVIEITE